MGGGPARRRARRERAARGRVADSAGGVRHVVSRADGRAHKDRLDALTGRLDAIAPGLGRAVRGLGTTLVAAQGGMGGG